MVETGLPHQRLVVVGWFVPGTRLGSTLVGSDEFADGDQRSGRADAYAHKAVRRLAGGQRPAISFVREDPPRPGLPVVDVGRRNR